MVEALLLAQNVDVWEYFVQYPENLRENTAFSQLSVRERANKIISILSHNDADIEAVKHL